MIVKVARKPRSGPWCIHSAPYLRAHAESQPVYKHRLFDAVLTVVSTGHKHPSTMPAASLCALCVMVPHLSKAVLRDCLQQVQHAADSSCVSHARLLFTP
jgi:hypothetical protein